MTINGYCFIHKKKFNFESVQLNFAHAFEFPPASEVTEFVLYATIFTFDICRWCWNFVWTETFLPCCGP